MKIIIVSILIMGSFVGAVGFLSSKITTFEECEKAGLLTRSIRIYDGGGSVEKECFLWIGKSFVKQKTAVDQSGLQIATLQKWETKTDDQPPVTVKVTPVEFGNNVQTWKFQIVFDTHSGSLDEDLLRVAVLTDDNGNEYPPTAWEGTGPGGHHREGVLIFNAINPLSPSVELKIKGVGGIPERLFRWSTQ